MHELLLHLRSSIQFEQGQYSWAKNFEGNQTRYLNIIQKHQSLLKLDLGTI